MKLNQVHDIDSLKQSVRIENESAPYVITLAGHPIQTINDLTNAAMYRQGVIGCLEAIQKGII